MHYEAKYAISLVSYNKSLAIQEKVLSKEHPDCKDRTNKSGANNTTTKRSN